MRMGMIVIAVNVRSAWLCSFVQPECVEDQEIQPSGGWMESQSRSFNQVDLRGGHMHPMSRGPPTSADQKPQTDPELDDGHATSLSLARTFIFPCGDDGRSVDVCVTEGFENRVITASTLCYIYVACQGWLAEYLAAKCDPPHLLTSSECHPRFLSTDPLNYRYTRYSRYLYNSALAV